MQVLEKAKEAMDIGKWEESASLIAQSSQHFQRGGASETEHRVAAQLLSKLQNAKDVFDMRARGLEALAAGEGFRLHVPLPLMFSIHWRHAFLLTFAWHRR